MLGEIENCQISHVRPKFDVFTLMPYILVNSRFWSAILITGAHEYKSLLENKQTFYNTLLLNQLYFVSDDRTILYYKQNFK